MHLIDQEGVVIITAIIIYWVYFARESCHVLLESRLLQRSYKVFEKLILQVWAELMVMEIFAEKIFIKCQQIYEI